MIYCPTGYSFAEMATNEASEGGSVFGCGTFAGAQGTRQPSAYEKRFAVHHGKHFGDVVLALKMGNSQIK